MNAQNVSDSTLPRVLHVSKYYHPFKGGLEEIARYCVRSLDGCAEQKVICFDHEDRKKDYRSRVDGVEVVRCVRQAVVASQPLSQTYGARLRVLLKEFDPDVVIFHYPNPLATHFLLKYLPAHTRLVLYWHLDIIKQKVLKQFFRGQNRALLERSFRVIVTSPPYIDGSDWLPQYKEKCRVIPNCIDESRLSVTPEIQEWAEELRRENEGKILCLAVGRHVEYKGFEYLIKASRRLDERFRIRIAGKGPLSEELKKLAAGDDKIYFPGLISDEELLAGLLACDIYCFPSVTRNEAFGLALAEGMYFGKPAVTFTIPGSGVNYVCPDGECGLEVANRDDAAYAAALTKLADDPALRQRLGENAAKRVRENFLYEVYAENMRAFLRECTES